VQVVALVHPSNGGHATTKCGCVSDGDYEKQTIRGGYRIVKRTCDGRVLECFCLSAVAS
jgi:hypothetical protein